MMNDRRLPRLIALGLATAGWSGAGLLHHVGAPMPGVRSAAAGETPKQQPSASAAATASASASVSSSSTGAGCVAESSATAEARAGERRQGQTAHKRVEQAGGPCSANAEAEAKARMDNPVPAEPPPE